MREAVFADIELSVSRTCSTKWSSAHSSVETRYSLQVVRPSLGTRSAGRLPDELRSQAALRPVGMQAQDVRAAEVENIARFLS